MHALARFVIGPVGLKARFEVLRSYNDEITFHCSVHYVVEDTSRAGSYGARVLANDESACSSCLPVPDLCQYKVPSEIQPALCSHDGVGGMSQQLADRVDVRCV